MAETAAKFLHRPIDIFSSPKLDVFVIVSWTSSSDWTSSSSSVGRHRRIYIFSSYYHLFFRYFFMCRTSSHLYGLVPVSFFCYHLCRYFSWERKGFSLKRKNALALVSKRILKSLPRPAIFRSLQNSVRAVAMPRITKDTKEIFIWCFRLSHPVASLFWHLWMVDAPTVFC